MATSPTSAEDDLIARFFRPLATAPGALALADDAAVWTPPPGCDLVLTKDALVAGVHFFPDDPADAVARKALRVNLSDLAAKGATPRGYLLAIALSEDLGADWLAGFSAGLREDGLTFGCPLFGGDTVRTPGPLMISVTAFGTVPEGGRIARAGARPGDRLFVSGTIGDAALGLSLRRGATMALDAAARAHLLQRYLLPQPRVALADAVRRFANAAMDISDGLAGDLAKLCRASGVSARVSVDDVPLSEAARAFLATDKTMLERALTGGDDYEILCAVSAEKARSFREAGAAAGVAVNEIGEIVAGEAAPALMAGDGTRLTFARASFSHF